MNKIDNSVELIDSCDIIASSVIDNCYRFTTITLYSALVYSRISKNRLIYRRYNDNLNCPLNGALQCIVTSAADSDI